MVLRWSRDSQPRGLSRRGRLNARTCDPGLGQRQPQGAGIAGAQPIVDHADVDPGPRLRRKRCGELAPDLVVVDDVVLEQDRALGIVDGFEPSRVVLRRILQQPDGIAVDGLRSGRARKRAVGEPEVRRFSRLRSGIHRASGQRDVRRWCALRFGVGFDPALRYGLGLAAAGGTRGARSLRAGRVLATVRRQCAVLYRQRRPPAQRRQAQQWRTSARGGRVGVGAMQPAPRSDQPGILPFGHLDRHRSPMPLPMRGHRRAFGDQQR